MSGTSRSSYGDGQGEENTEGRPWSIGSQLLGHYQEHLSVPDDQGSQRRLHDSYISDVSRSSAFIAIHNGTQAQDKEETDSTMEGGPPKLVRANTTMISRVITDWWWWELLSWLISFFATAAIVVVLLLYSERPLPHWPLGFTINAYISILAALAKAAMILPVAESLGQLKWIWFTKEKKLLDFFTFDGASRGPWGALMLLRTTKIRNLASLGALITVLALAFETFFQQIVAYPERNIISGNSSVSVANSFSLPTSQVGTAISGDPQTLAMIEASYYGNETITPPPSTCPTGNCTWPTYSSLAVCSQCKDVTNLLQWFCKNHTEVFLVDAAKGSTEYACGWIFDDSFKVGWTYEYADGVVLSMLSVGVPYGDQGHLISHNSTHFADVANPLLDIYVAYAPGGIQSVLRNDTPVMQECLLSWCVQSYHGLHNGGVLNETVIETYWDQTSTKGEVTITPPNMDRSFTVSNGTTQLFHDYFLSQDAGLSEIVMYEPANSTRTSYEGIYNFMMVPPYDITPYLADVALAITNSIRRKSTGTEGSIGAAWIPETFVQIRWVWITLPALLILFSFTFIVGTIVKSTKLNVAIWKTSALAMLLHGLTGEARHKMDPEAAASEVEAAAKNVRVVLSAEKEHSRLVLV